MLRGKIDKVLDYHDEFLCEVEDEYGDVAGELMCASYKYASDKCFEWHNENNQCFPNKTPVSFPFNLDGGYKVSDLGSKGTYLQTH